MPCHFRKRVQNILESWDAVGSVEFLSKSDKVCSNLEQSIVIMEDPVVPVVAGTAAVPDEIEQMVELFCPSLAHSLAYG